MSPLNGEQSGTDAIVAEPAAGSRIATRLLELLLGSSLLLPMLFYPIGRDQGMFAYCGQVILDGGAPYRDVFDHKGPATYYGFAAILGLFGSTMLGVRTFFFLLAVVASQLVAALAQRLSSPAARVPSIVCFAAFAIHAGLRGCWITSQTEDILFVLYLGSVLLLMSFDAKPSSWKLFVVGGLLGLAVSFKPTAILCGLGLGAAALWQWHADDRAGLITLAKRFGLSTLGFATPLVAFAVCLAMQGALADCYKFVIEMNMQYAGRREGTWADGMLIFAAFWSGATLVGLIGYFATKQACPKLRRLLITLIVTSLLTVVWQWKFTLLYHWTPMVGGIVIFAGVGLARIVEHVKASIDSVALRRAVTVGVYAGASCIVSTKVLALLVVWSMTAQILAGTLSLERYQAIFPTGSEGWGKMRPVATYLNENTSPDEGVVVWGYDVLINFVADRRNPSRFAINRPLDHSPRVKEYRAEFIRDIENNPPKYIVIVNEECFFSFNRPAPEVLEDFSEFNTILAQQYRLEKTFDIYDVYRRSETSPPRSLRDQRTAKGQSS